jgi:glycosyltransferase involved in cell wall biosynthesis
VSGLQQGESQKVSATEVEFTFEFAGLTLRTQPPELHESKLPCVNWARCRLAGTIGSLQFGLAQRGKEFDWSVVRFSIVTPSLRQLDWLRLAIRSVADQGVQLEHLIQDGGSGAEVVDWVRGQSDAMIQSEPDAGMYDALNRGFARATGDIWAWLNCDEQYLPDALAAVAQRFQAEPELDVLLADNVIVDRSGEYVAHRFSLVPSLTDLWMRFPVASCALFFRPRVWRPFDLRWKSAGDWWWFRAMLEQGARVGILREFVAAFTETEANLGLAPVSQAEQAIILQSRPWWVRVFKPVLLTAYRYRMWRSGAFSVKPFRYRIYTGDELERREFVAARPSARWRRNQPVPRRD